MTRYAIFITPKVPLPLPLGSIPLKYHMGRVSKSCNHAIKQLRKIFENLRKFRTNKRQPGKTGTNVVYLPQFNNAF